jgi:hypothetical protein
MNNIRVILNSGISVISDYNLNKKLANWLLNPPALNHWNLKLDGSKTKLVIKYK